MPFAAYRFVWALSGAFFFALSLPSHAQSVALTGVLGGKALLVIDGGAPRVVGPQDGHVQGVRVLQVHGDRAEIERQGERHTLVLGQTPVSVGQPPPSPQGRRLTLHADGQGHFRAQGWINNQPITYLVDTGASTVALSTFEAQRLGLDYRQGTPVMVQTAGGTQQAWRIRLSSVRIGDIQQHGVDAVVTPQPMPFVLLGNSFLSQLHLIRQGNSMVLEKR